MTVRRAEQETLTVTGPDRGDEGDRLELSASGGSGTGPVTFRVVGGSDACAIVSQGAEERLAITSDTGSCDIRAQKAGDGNYEPIESAVHAVSIGAGGSSMPDWLLPVLLGLLVLGALAALAVRRFRRPPPQPPPASAPRPVADAPTTALVPERSVEVGFAPADAPEWPLAADMPLEAGRPYLFWLDVGPPVVLPRVDGGDARLTVALFSLDGFELEPGAEVGELELGADGGVRVVGRPADAAQPAARERAPLPARPGAGPGGDGPPALQHLPPRRARAVAARHVRRPAPGDASPGNALSAIVDYTLAPALDPAHLRRLPQHRLSVLLNRNERRHARAQLPGRGRLHQQRDPERRRRDRPHPPGPRRVTRGVVGRRGPVGDAEALPLRGRRPRAPASRPGPVRPPGLPLLRIDRGHARRRPRRGRPSGRANAPAGPAADRDEGVPHAPPARRPALRLRRLSLRRRTRRLRALPGLPRLAPARAAARAHRMLHGRLPQPRRAVHASAPAGSGATATASALPVSIRGAPDAATEISPDPGPTVVIAVSTDEQFVLRTAHERALERLLDSGGAWRYADSQAETLRLLKEGRPHLVYFYCHGGFEHGVPYLQVGPLGDEPITPDLLLSERIRWDSPRPFVFVNGCRTTALDPDQALELVSVLMRRARAAGVMGTEITIFEPLARAFAEDCLRRFLSGTELGEAVRAARLALLKDGNPLGLAYIPFALPSLHMRPAASEATAVTAVL